MIVSLHDDSSDNRLSIFVLSSQSSHCPQPSQIYWIHQCHPPEGSSKEAIFYKFTEETVLTYGVYQWLAIAL